MGRLWRSNRPSLVFVQACFHRSVVFDAWHRSHTSLSAQNVVGEWIPDLTSFFLGFSIQAAVASILVSCCRGHIAVSGLVTYSRFGRRFFQDVSRCVMVKPLFLRFIGMVLDPLGDIERLDKGSFAGNC